MTASDDSLVMKALVFHHPGKVSVDSVSDPKIEHPEDVILRVTATAICGSDLHIYNGFFPQKKDMVLGHEFMGIVEEAGDDLFTFLRVPTTQWKALRTTNALERINGEFRRRTKTQASLPGQEAVLLLLFGLLRSGHVKLRKIDGWEDMERVGKAA